MLTIATMEGKQKNMKSPLTAAALSNNETKPRRHGAKSSRAAKRLHQEELTDRHEEELTAKLFGKKSRIVDNEIQDQSEFVSDNKNGYEWKEESVLESDFATNNAPSVAVEDSQPAWNDTDKLSHNQSPTSASRLKKLRRVEDDGEAFSNSELEVRLRNRYDETAQKLAHTKWATVQEGDEGQGMDSNKTLLSTSGPLLASSYHRLRPNHLDIVRLGDANQAERNNAVVQAVCFHRGSDPDEPLLMTAGLDKTLRFYQVGLEDRKKVHGIHFPRMPIYSASFLGTSGNVVASGRRPFFYIYDAVAGKVDCVSSIMGREEKSWEKHVTSPDGKLIAFTGNDGYVVLVDSHNKHWVGNLKINGSVRATTFTPDGRFLLATGSDGDIYRWDIASRRCIDRFSNNDGTISSSIAASSSHVAVGAESGVVNLYSEHSAGKSQVPIKSAMNLHTSADLVRFNEDGQILAMSTRREQQGLKLMHVPSRTVFSNWPTAKTPLKYVWSMDFSPQSRFFAIGNDKGSCLLYNLTHYNSD